MTDRRILEPHQRMLLDAAEYLEDFGWCQKRVGSVGGPRCVHGAMLAVIAGEDDYYNDIFKAANRLLCKHLGLNLYIYSTCGFPAGNWNDEPDRTKEEVIAALRAAVFAEESVDV